MTTKSNTKIAYRSGEYRGYEVTVFEHNDFEAGQWVRTYFTFAIDRYDSFQFSTPNNADRAGREAVDALRGRK